MSEKRWSGELGERTRGMVLRGMAAFAILPMTLGLTSCDGASVDIKPAATATSETPSPSPSEATPQPVATATVTETVTAPPSSELVVEETVSLEESLAPDRLTEEERVERSHQAQVAVLRALEAIPLTREAELAGEDAPVDGVIAFAELRRAYGDGDRSVVQSLAVETSSGKLVVRLTSTEVCLEGDEPVGCAVEKDGAYELRFGGVVPAGEAFTLAELRGAMQSGQAILVGGRIAVSGHEGTYDAEVMLGEDGRIRLVGGEGMTARQELDGLLVFGGYGRS